jgi:suppressor for copper-sensitivity B
VLAPEQALAPDRAERAQASPSGAEAAAGGWQRFDAGRIGALVREGRVVLVDVTADWCLTCKVQKRLVLDTDSVRRALAEAGALAMQADWTQPDPAISAYLASFGRAGIPMNVVYGPAAPAGILLPELLTPERVRDALAQAAGVQAAGARATAAP